MSKVRVGIVGCGRISDMHAPGYLAHPDAEIYAICDVNQETCDRRRVEWKAKKSYLQYEDLLADPKVDLVEIITPHNLHCSMVEQAAAAGKHISVQKPMALNAAECDRMIDAAKKAGVHLKVFENFVFYPPYVKAKELLENGEIGDPLSVRFKLGAGGGGWRVPLTTWIWRVNKEMCGPGPNLFDDGYHKFSQGIDLFGEVDSVHCWIDYSFQFIDSPAMVGWTYKDSPVKGYFDTALVPHVRMRGKYYGAEEQIEITGTKGVIYVTRCTSQLRDEPSLLLYKDGQTIAFEDLRADWMDSFTDSTWHYIDVIRNGGDPKLSGEKGKEVLQFALAAYKSNEKGRPIKPEEIA